MRKLAFVLFITFCTSVIAQQTPILLFPNGAPGETKRMVEQEKMSDNKTGGCPVLLINNVSKPTITFYPAPADNNSGTTIIVNPGGGYNILAYNLEGTEICKRFNSFGINCVLLKYRVPRREGLAKHAAPLQDMQRAIAYTRAHSKEWNIDENKIGVMGFSAGAHLATMASNSFSKPTYPAIDESDGVSVRPDFCMLIYPAYLDGENFSVSPEINVTDKTPPTFIVQAQDDTDYINSSLFYYYALKEAKVSAAMHLYPTGGHGYGLRNTGDLVNEWPFRAVNWLSDIGMLNK
ncbi:MAG TPA: alpha/beta hydrolase [Dysgonamonadaceae bacterium]|nr:alpha/beta hydrolase [Dysgonamonadaceae bacterium]